VQNRGGLWCLWRGLMDTRNRWMRSQVLGKEASCQQNRKKRTMKCDCCGADEWDFLFVEGPYRLGKCKECELHYVDPMPDTAVRMTEIETGHFAGTEEVLNPESQLASERVQSRSMEGYVDLVKRYMGSGRWLDVGCGAGWLVALAKEAGYQAEGIELTAGRRELARMVTGSVIHDEPIEALALPDRSLDVVSLINVFSHLTSPSSTLREIHRVLNKDGLLLIVTGVVGPMVQKKHMWSWGLGDHLYFLGQGTLTRYNETLGYSLLEEKAAWAPAATMTPTHLRTKGRSCFRNLVKAVVLNVPGAFPAARRIFLRTQANNPIHSTTFLLRRDGLYQGNGPAMSDFAP
jgi:SAM-dependent methyltransferase